MALFKIILKQMELPIFKRYPSSKVNKALELAFKTKECRKQKAQIIVAEVNGNVAGMAFGYPDESNCAVDSLLCHYFPQVGLPRIKSIYDEDSSESFNNEWYLDSLVVNPKFRGQGIASALLNYLPKIALTHHKKIIGLDVDFKNPTAAKLYRRFGFYKVTTLKISAHNYQHLQLKIT
ncbi:GNAT family N-acetyltransferase [Ligilactobacillus sp. WILCCON 0076]|uniref:GNAT family N-acetyltransferase n=1 Tax=Ligilactobacillus ubinensis TaxID=2876789 RepID=A0A9X2FHZ4_9LACO|nr:GNAT family N-acetyltransferase [Ligilactobacillus ubinensis]MCP0886331.1 GNAT family N-acetyltransferase [Ligilactobacillus ubinensis]